MTQKTFSHYFSAILLILQINMHLARGRDAAFQVNHTVELSNPGTNVFRVTTDVENIGEEHLNLSLPAWTPGIYVLRDYAKNILRFKITDAKGAPVSYKRVRNQTWRINTKGLDRVKIQFDYRAERLASELYVPRLNEATIAKDFAYFTGVQMFLLAEGHRRSSSKVHFIAPTGWKVMSSLRETTEPMTFMAPDYDTLVDAPVLMGHFDVTRFEVGDKPHFFATTPAGAFSSDNTKKLTEVLRKIALSERAIFGALPYEKYTYFYFILPPKEIVGEGGALEHLNSFTAFVPAGDFPLESVAWTAAHEFFHLWNVKRIRPVEMWPYDYQKPNETSLLWVSEGFSNYYAVRTLHRLGLNDRRRFLDRVASTIKKVETTEARAYISPAEASVSDWTPGKVFASDFYAQGQNLATLLDLSIRHDSHGMASLDDVMRGLFREFYQRGKGFSEEDMIGLINRLTDQDYHGFYQRYVQGVEELPYDTIYGYAGYRIEKLKRKLPLLPGWVVEPVSGKILRVMPGGPAALAGAVVGDIILKPVSGEKRQSDWMPDTTYKVTIKRAGAEQEISLKFGSPYEMEDYKLVEVSDPTTKQLKLREEWLRED
jgi:predicted metalloprotease with PDZ domain